MKPSAIYSKSGKGVQEASGKTSLLKRGDRAVLSAIDGRATLAEVAQKVGKSFDGPFQQLIAQLDRDGFVREVTTGASSISVATVKPAAAKAPAAKPPVSQEAAVDLDFTSIMPVLKRGGAAPAAAPAPRPTAQADTVTRAKEQEAALYKARQEAEARAQAERDRLRQEAEAKARAEAEVKIRAETEKKLREEAEAKLKAEAEAKARAAREAALRIAAEAKAKAEAEAQARIEAERRARDEAERKAREEAERARREAEELRQRLEEERRAREAEERKRREEEERRRKEEEQARQRRDEEERLRREEEERRRREEEERRLREEIEARAREAAEQTRREEEDRLLRDKEAQAQQARAMEEARAQQARAMEEARARAAQRQREDDERARRTRDTRTRQPTLPPELPELPEIRAEAASAGGGSLDALMADLDSFSQREDEERQGREAAERAQRDEKKRRAEEQAQRSARERSALEERERQRAAEEARRREEEERRAQEEAERRLREVEESRRLEAEERRQRAREVLAAKSQTPADDDIAVSEADLGMDDVRRDEAAVARETRKAQREREREAREREREARARAEAAAREQPIKYPRARRPIKWGRPVALTFFAALVAGVAALHIMPLPMEKYEDAASEALGRPVKIGSGRLSLFTGVQLNLREVTVGGNIRIASARAHPRIGSLIDERKAFRRIELEGVTLPQQGLGDSFMARMRMANFEVSRILVTNLRLAGPVPLPAFEADAMIGSDGAVREVTLRGPDALTARLTPAANGDVELEVTAASVVVPFVPELTLSSFAMKGLANRQGMTIPSWGGAALDGALSGTARVRWTGPWQVDGVVIVRGINAAVFAPALLSEGKAEGSGRFSMSGPDPAKLYNGARVDGSFTVGKGALGSFDLSRALRTSGSQHGGRTPFTEMSGQVLYDRGAVALRNISMSAGALHAGASADIAPSGALAGRIVADIRTTVQPLRAVLILGGTVKEPQVRN